jgi:hypothetical protein
VTHVRGPAKNVPDNLSAFREAWPPLVEHAERHGVKIAMENCPMIFSYDEWPGGTSLAYAPAIWREMLEASRPRASASTSTRRTSSGR